MSLLSEPLSLALAAPLKPICTIVCSNVLKRYFIYINILHRKCLSVNKAREISGYNTHIPLL